MENRPEEQGNLCRCSSHCWVCCDPVAPLLRWGCEAQHAAATQISKPLRTCSGNKPPARGVLPTQELKHGWEMFLCEERWRCSPPAFYIGECWVMGLRLSSYKHRGARQGRAQYWTGALEAETPCPVSFLGHLGRGASRQAPGSPRRLSDLHTHGLMVGCWRRLFGGCINPVPKGKKEGDRGLEEQEWAERERGAVVGKQAAAQQCVWLCLPPTALSALPENSFQFFLNMNKMHKTK